MSKLSSGLPIPDKRAAEKKHPVKPTVMIITMILMTSALILTAVMMIDYATRKKNESTATAAAEKPLKPGKALTFLKTLTTHTNAPEETTEAERENSFSFFGKSDGNRRWPKLKLTGHGMRPDGSGAFAIINGHQYQTGQFINGKVRIIEIRQNDVLVEFSGETNTLIVDVHN
ncbi:hypothetical protein EGM51_17925 [Verrucomicrobia bacterium S94]|nr:hypothetical protein EGM51_17925 [Verrucomicrobia bacterium S94]